MLERFSAPSCDHAPAVKQVFESVRNSMKRPKIHPFQGQGIRRVGLNQRQVSRDGSKTFQLRAYISDPVEINLRQPTAG